MRKLKFFAIGLVPGLLLVFFILNKKGASCTGYLPNSRVIAESLSKKAVYSDAFSAEMQANNIDEVFVKDSIMTHGYVDFYKSRAQEKPCPTYTLVYPKNNPRYEITFEKCTDETTFQTLEQIR